MLLSFILSLGTALAASVPLAGDRAPEFTLKSITGESVSLSQYKGSVIVLGLFHICEPCMIQATQMQKLLNEGQSKAVFLGINTAGDSEEDVRSYLNQFETRITFSYLLDPARDINKKYFQRLMPTVLVIDGNGIIRYRGSSTPAALLLSEIKKATAK
ncbi:MAG: TlpA family protein disulfide reductase [Nitrospirae bacterium]|nr:TlpA family protein disulfide reductase [Nitrospirota bacterium]